MVFEDVADGLVGQERDAGVGQGAAEVVECAGCEDGVSHWVGHEDEDVFGFYRHVQAVGVNVCAGRGVRG